MTAADPSCVSWIGSALRHVRADDDRDVLDFHLAGTQRGNRWNESPRPTEYVASDPEVLVAEWGRHLGSYSGQVTVKRDANRLHISMRAVLDHRTSRVEESLVVPKILHWFSDTVITRLVGNRVRPATRAQAMLVPSVAFLDDLTRWNLVFSLDKVPTGTATRITQANRL